VELNKLNPKEPLRPQSYLRIPYFGQTLNRSTNMPHVQLGALMPQADSRAVRRVRLSTAKKYVGELYWPVDGGRVSSPFGSRWLNFHEGIDIAAEEGTTLFAAADGIVVYSDRQLRGYGNLIVIKSTDLMTVYGHNQRNLVHVGQRVRRGQKIGLLGQSGKAQGPHLHFETRIKDAAGKNIAVDPLAFFVND
jgi:murein DD-endopeptidase MepM/ murein hydrolase activator NlpD